MSKRGVALTEFVLGWCGLLLIGIVGAVADRDDRAEAVGWRRGGGRLVARLAISFVTATGRLFDWMSYSNNGETERRPPFHTGTLDREIR